MARQIVKGLMMLMAIVGLALATAVAANGQAGKAMKANVPFDFIVVDKTLRAGEYDVRIANAEGDTVAIANAEDQALRLSHSAQRSDRQTAAKLVFHRYGNTYFLSQVWMAGDDTGRELPKARQERAIERELKMIAAHGRETKPAYEVVEVLATP